jgi:hypothetical protein
MGAVLSTAYKSGNQGAKIESPIEVMKSYVRKRTESRYHK